MGNGSAKNANVTFLYSINSANTKYHTTVSEMVNGRNKWTCIYACEMWPHLDVIEQWLLGKVASKGKARWNPLVLLLSQTNKEGGHTIRSISKDRGTSITFEIEEEVRNYSQIDESRRISTNSVCCVKSEHKGGAYLGKEMGWTIAKRRRRLVMCIGDRNSI